MGVLWGIPYLLIKIALEGLSVPVLVFARTLVGAALLLPLVLTRANARAVAAHWKPLLAFAFLTSSTTGLLIAATPIIAVLLDRASGGTHRLGALRMAGLATGIIGVAVLAGPGLAGGGAWPITQVLLAATCYAIAPLIAARHLADVPALPLTASCLAFAALVYTAPAFLSWPTETPSTRVLVATVLLAVLCTATAFIVFFALIREIGPTRALVITYINPAVALVAGVVILAEPLTLFNIAGLALILVGSVLATHHREPQHIETNRNSPV